jgi:hypothetical protein
LGRVSDEHGSTWGDNPRYLPAARPMAKSANWIGCAGAGGS